MPTGMIGKSRPSAATDFPPITAVSAAAPPGGCRQRSNDIARMAPPTASPAATGIDDTNSAVTTPTAADTTLPPTIDHGCASGLEGTANSSTADAPTGATSQGVKAGSTVIAQIIAVRPMPITAPIQAIKRSWRLAPARIGSKKCCPCRKSRIIGFPSQVSRLPDVRPASGERKLAWSRQRRSSGTAYLREWGNYW